MPQDALTGAQYIFGGQSQVSRPVFEAGQCSADPARAWMQEADCHGRDWGGFHGQLFTLGEDTGTHQQQSVAAGAGRTRRLSEQLELFGGAEAAPSLARSYAVPKPQSARAVDGSGQTRKQLHREIEWSD